MTQSDRRHLHVVLYEGHGSRPLGEAERLDAVIALLEAGYDVTCAAAGASLVIDDSFDVVVVGRFEQCPCRSHAGGAGPGQLHYVEMSSLDADALVAGVDLVRSRLGAPKPGAWMPWFPVIDYDRCTNCMQCLSFCLFGVYGLDADGRVEVQNPDHCKTGCPACARVCPNVAIIFPKYDKRPINGDIIREEDEEREAVKVDLSALLGPDIHSSLRARRQQAKRRFAVGPDLPAEPAEGTRNLRKLQTELDIPDEVIQALPLECAYDCDCSRNEYPADEKSKLCDCQTGRGPGEEQCPGSIEEVREG